MNLTSNYSRVAIVVKDNDPNTTYFNIGHGKLYHDPTHKADNRKNEIYLYIWPLGGELQVKGPYTYNNNINHSNEFNMVDPDYSEVFSGRYDVEQKMVSIIVPTRFRFRDLPSRIVNGLESAFPEAEKLIRFSF